MLDEMMVNEFIIEAKEQLKAIEADFLELEKSGTDWPLEIINRIFRAIHTLKGGAGFIGLENISKLSHRMENLLSQFRDGKIKPEQSFIDTLLDGLDHLRAMIDDAMSSNSSDISAIVGKLDGVLTQVETKKNLDKPVFVGENGDQLDVDTDLLKNCPKELTTFFLLELNLSVVEKEGTKIYDFIKSLSDIGYLVDGKLNFSEEGVGISELDKVLYKALIATKLTKNELEDRFGKKLLGLETIFLKQKDELKKAPVTEKKTSEKKGEKIKKGEKTTSQTPKELYELVEENKPKYIEIPDLEIPAPIKASETGEILQPSSKSVPYIEIPDMVVPEKLEVKEEQKTITYEIPANKPIPELTKTETQEPVQTAQKKEAPDETVRIHVSLIDKLMILASELVLVRNQSLLFAEKTEDTGLLSTIQRLDIITSEVQETIMKTRMQPVGNIFNKFPRVIRDLAKKLGKDIELVIRGAESELDKTLIENLTDPLTHLIRNCCDHGIEKPEIRKNLGKPEKGKVWLNAFHESGQINIVIKDDGKGIDPDFIAKKAMEKGMKSEEEIKLMNKREKMNLIALPGFSTAEKVSDVSGRGVGMDVVKTNIEKLGGSFEIESEINQGTSIKLRLPLTLAIVPSFIIKSRNKFFAIPQTNIEEIVSLYNEDKIKKIEYAGDWEIYRLRDFLLPIMDLSEILARKEPFSAETKKEIIDNNPRKNSSGNAITFLVIKAGKAKFGLIVDKVIGTEEIVVKPMHPVLKNLHIYSGSTIMGDGSVALILDVEGIGRHIGIQSYIDEREAQDKKDESKPVQKSETVILFNNGFENFAVTLSNIMRIEKISSKQIERAGYDEFVTIDNRSTKILKLESFLNVQPTPVNEEMYFLLSKARMAPCGILVTNLVDSLTTAMDLDIDTYKNQYVNGTKILNGNMTIFLNIPEILNTAVGG